ncbi:hypothetical protein BO99DRAFT_180813 [Aspergillus violaceofuscus CBS 115571]|uniref:Uncharacterized protein n=1 Tax=Aspergillus violaceofuscus (strain CBS 115571) TaxID=1450538 RepID=A0A2V5HPI8_ASPV1|nr:hypothetical protein BO99DRAFT_180813 [Aspergillus violaceofuscus CBS 115571]
MDNLRPAHSRLTRAQFRQQHLLNLKTFSNDLQEALSNAQPSGGNFKSVEVLALRFENDTMGVDALERELLDVFQSVYHYNTSSFVIPVINSEDHLYQHLIKWTLDRAQKETLRIYVYSGHGAPAGTTDLTWWIGGQVDAHGNLRGPRVNIRALLYSCERFDGEVLYIFDCCSAGSIAMRDGPEALTACGWEQESSTHPNWSFTRVLIDTLKDIKGQPTPVCQIFSRMYRFCQQNQIGRCPLHIPKMGRPSITLRPLHTASTRPIQPVRTHNRVLLCITLNGGVSVPSIQEWQRWLTTNVPADVLGVEVKVEAAFSGSCKLLITVPVEIWTMLPLRDNYHFVAHVTSNNTLDTSTPLPYRPAAPSGRENRPLAET